MHRLVTLPFSISEYKDRVAKVREGMKQRGIDVLMINTPENLYYLTNYQTASYGIGYLALILPIEGEPIMITRVYDRDNVPGRTWIEESVYYLDQEDPIQVAAETVRKMKLDKKTVGVEKNVRKAFLSIAEFEKLQKLLPNARFVDGSGIIENLRIIKSNRELDYIRQAARIVEKGMKAGIDMIEAGKLDGEIAGEINRVLYSSGSEYPADLPFVPSIPLAQAQHEGRRLERGQIVRFEIPACVKRYHAALIRTVSLGKLPKKYKSMEEASRKALEAGIEVMKPGVEAQEVHRVMQRELARFGYGELHKHRSGHSIGIAFPPCFSGEGEVLSLKEGEHAKLRPGMVFHIVGAGLKVPGKLLLCTGSETVAVTEEDHEVLTHFVRKVFVK